MSAETREFKAELKQLLHLITHSLYSDREIFLRELISNASDALNKVKFNSLDNEAALENDKDWKITITPDKAAGTLTIRDNGVGMTRNEVIDHLGTVAKSGTKAYLDAVHSKKDAASLGLIGQFGVGFYAAFMVADTVTVLTRPAGGPALGSKWVSAGQGEFTIEAAEKPGRGTDVILTLKGDAKEFLDPWKLRQLVKKFSDFIEYPVALVSTEEKDGVTTAKEEVVNNQKALWLRAKSEVKPEEYDEFYKQLAHDDKPPAKVLHFSAEGKTEFKALLYIPAHRPFAYDWDDRTGGLKLYVQRVLIMEKCESILPPYLRFVQGVVDSADLPLNVSREILQQNPHLETIRKNVVRNVLSGLEGLKNNNYEAYLGFYAGLGPILKEGLARDWENKDKIADLLLYESLKTEPGQFTTLADYVAKMPAEQTEIVYLTGETAEHLRHSPYLEAFAAKGYDVLLLTDPIDEFAIPQFGAYKEKTFVDAARTEAKAAAEEVAPFVVEQYANLLAALKFKLPEVADVRLTKRLTNSAACLVADANAMTAHMERLMKKFGEGADGNKRVLELNPDHPAVAKLRDIHTLTPDDPRVESYARLFYDQAVVAEGSKVPDPVAFSKRINDLLVG